MGGMVRETEQNNDPFFIKYINQRIRQNKNFVCLISGQTGSGKSWSALSIAEMLDPDFHMRQVIFKGTELLALINSNKLKRGSVIIWDEAGIDLSNRAWMSATNKLLNFVFQTFRHKGYILFFTTPYSDFVDKQTRRLFHCEMKTIKINFKNKTTKIKPLLLQWASFKQDFYRHRLQVNVAGGGFAPLDFWDVPAPSKELIDKYEILKTDFTSKLNAEIEAELNKIEGTKTDDADKLDEQKRIVIENGIVDDVKGKKSLTQLQMEVLLCWKRGVFSTSKIAGELGKKSDAISNRIKAMRQKGYYKEKYMEMLQDV